MGVVGKVKKLKALNLSNYNAKMIRNRAEAMSCGGCHQNSNNTATVSGCTYATRI
jgi:hypothetical protein